MDPEVPEDAGDAAASRLTEEGLALLEARNAELRRSPAEALGRHVRLLRLVVVDEVPVVPGQAADRRVSFEADLRQLFGDLLTTAPVSGELVARFEGEGLTARCEGKDDEVFEVTQGARIDARICVRLEEKNLMCRSLQGVEKPPSLVFSSDSLPVNTFDPEFDGAYRDLAPKLIDFVGELVGREKAMSRAAVASHWRLREGAVRRLDDQRELVRLATCREPPDLRKAGIARLEDRELLGSVIQTFGRPEGPGPPSSLESLHAQQIEPPIPR